MGERRQPLARVDHHAGKTGLLAKIVIREHAFILRKKDVSQRIVVAPRENRHGHDFAFMLIRRPGVHLYDKLHSAMRTPQGQTLAIFRDCLQELHVPRFAGKLIVCDHDQDVARGNVRRRVHRIDVAAPALIPYDGKRRNVALRERQQFGRCAGQRESLLEVRFRRESPSRIDAQNVLEAFFIDGSVKPRVIDRAPFFGPRRGMQD